MRKFVCKNSFMHVHTYDYAEPLTKLQTSMKRLAKGSEIRKQHIDTTLCQCVEIHVCNYNIYWMEWMWRTLLRACEISQTAMKTCVLCFNSTRVKFSYNNVLNCHGHWFPMFNILCVVTPTCTYGWPEAKLMIISNFPSGTLEYSMFGCLQFETKPLLHGQLLLQLELIF